MNLNRYALFAGSFYYPSGGWKDLVQTFYLLSDAKNRAERMINEQFTNWVQLVDLEKAEVIKDWSSK